MCYQCLAAVSCGTAVRRELRTDLRASALRPLPKRTAHTLTLAIQLVFKDVGSLKRWTHSSETSTAYGLSAYYPVFPVEKWIQHWPMPSSALEAQPSASYCNVWYQSDLDASFVEVEFLDSCHLSALNYVYPLIQAIAR